MILTPTIFIGARLEHGSEIQFLHDLVAAFPEPETLIFANFLVKSTQIDFVVVRATGTGMIELKHLTGPITGGENGSWSLIDSAGSTVATPNAYEQATRASFALSDAMRVFRRKNPSVPVPPKGKDYNNFVNFVAIAPEIAAASTLTRGDKRAFVRSAPDVIEAIRKGSPSTWDTGHWRSFANSLRLESVTLDQAVDPKVYEAASLLDAYRTRVIASRMSLPPLINFERESAYGAALVQRIIDGGNTQLIGVTGSAKSFHVRHAARALAEANGIDVPIFVGAKRYQGGDFVLYLRQCLAPYHIGDLRSLTDALKLTARRPILIVDGLNECGSKFREDFLAGISMFAVQYGARTVTTSQSPCDIPGIDFETITVDLPDAEQRRAIYAFHANIAPLPDIDRLCGSFRNAYELQIAGRCHATGGRPPRNVVELYDRYVIECMPSSRASVAGALARKIADEMGNRGALHLSRNECETIAEAFLTLHNAPLSVLDDLFSSELFDARSDVVVFEHELLVLHLRAAALQRRIPQLADLRNELARPINFSLIELLLPRLEDRERIRAALGAVPHAQVLERAARGEFGKASKDCVFEFFDAYVSTAIADLEDFAIEIPEHASPLRPLEFSTRPASAFDRRLADAIALSIDVPEVRARVLSLFDVTQAIFEKSVADCAKRFSLRPITIWSNLIHSTLALRSTASLRATDVIQSLNKYHEHLIGSSFDRRLEPALHQALVERALRGGSLLAVFVLLDHNGFPEPSLRAAEVELALIQQAWNSGAHKLQVASMMRLHISERFFRQVPDVYQRVVDFLEPLHSDDLLLSTTIVDALSRFDLLPIPISDNEAKEILQAVLKAPDDIIGSPQQRSELAYKAVANMFEDIYQSVFSDAIEELSSDERINLYLLASDTTDGFHLPYVLGELVKLNSLKALPAFRKHAATIDLTTPFSQDATAVYIIAHVGYARFAEAPPTRASASSPLEAAWQVIGDALFWSYYDNGQFMRTHGDRALDSLFGDELLAASFALAEFVNILQSVMYRVDGFADIQAATIIELWAAQIRRIASHGLRKRDVLPTLAIRARFEPIAVDLVKLLALVGDHSSIDTLRGVLDDSQLGSDALAALRSIDARHLAS